MINEKILCSYFFYKELSNEKETKFGERIILNTNKHLVLILVKILNICFKLSTLLVFKLILELLPHLGEQKRKLRLKKPKNI